MASVGRTLSLVQHFVGMVAPLQRVASFVQMARRRLGGVALSGLVLAGLAACNEGGGSDTLIQKLNEMTDAEVACRRERGELLREVADLKNKLEAASANANKVVSLADPEIIELEGDASDSRRPESPVAGPEFNPSDASKTLLAGAASLQTCYERALKRNEKLQMSAGTSVRLYVTVHPSGKVEGVEVEPNLDAEMTKCMVRTGKRWKFAKFGGTPITLEQKIRLTPKR